MRLHRTRGYDGHRYVLYFCSVRFEFTAYALFYFAIAVFLGANNNGGVLAVFVKTNECRCRVGMRFCRDSNTESLQKQVYPIAYYTFWT